MGPLKLWPLCLGHEVRKQQTSKACCTLHRRKLGQSFIWTHCTPLRPWVVISRWWSPAPDTSLHGCRLWHRASTEYKYVDCLTWGLPGAELKGGGVVMMLLRHYGKVPSTLPIRYDRLPSIPPPGLEFLRR